MALGSPVSDLGLMSAKNNVPVKTVQDGPAPRHSDWEVKKNSCSCILIPQPDLCMETRGQLTDVMITCDHGEGIIGVIVQIVATQFIYYTKQFASESKQL